MSVPQDLESIARETTSAIHASGGISIPIPHLPESNSSVSANGLGDKDKAKSNNIPHSEVRGLKRPVRELNDVHHKRRKLIPDMLRGGKKDTRRTTDGGVKKIAKRSERDLQNLGNHNTSSDPPSTKTLHAEPASSSIPFEPLAYLTIFGNKLELNKIPAFLELKSTVLFGHEGNQPMIGFIRNLAQCLSISTTMISQANTLLEIHEVQTEQGILRLYKPYLVYCATQGNAYWARFGFLYTKYEEIVHMAMESKGYTEPGGKLFFHVMFTGGAAQDLIEEIFRFSKDYGTFLDAAKYAGEDYILNLKTDNEIPLKTGTKFWSPLIVLIVFISCIGLAVYFAAGLKESAIAVAGTGRNLFEELLLG